MTMPSISNAPSPLVGGLVASRHGHARTPPSSAPVVSTGASATAAEPLASAIAAALTQLGLIPDIHLASPDAATSANGVSPALDPPQAQAAQQIQRYRNLTPAFSGLAQMLSDRSGHAPTATHGLASTFQSLWTSLGASSGLAVDASGNAIPSLPTFLNALARNLSESGVTGLRGVFVDTVA